jgi:hypothetical protein
MDRRARAHRRLSRTEPDHAGPAMDEQNLLGVRMMV